MTGRRYNRRPVTNTPIGGGKGGDKRPIASPFANECTRCGNDMESEADMRPVRGGGWVHRWCVSGGDDE